MFTHMTNNKKPIETCQGKCKSDVDTWVAVVKEKKILFEVAEVDEMVAREALRLAAHKLPIKTKFIKKEIGGENNEG